MTRMIPLWVALAAFATACDGAGGASATDAATGDASDATAHAVPCERPVADDGEPLGCVTGRLVDAEGAALEGLKVSACTLATCIVGQTDAAGVYRIGGLPVEPHKMEVLGQLKGFATMIYFQPVVAGAYTEPSRDIVMPALERPGTPWAPDAGGTVSLAGGALELTAAPGTLEYPLGTVDKEVLAAELAAEDLPPFDIEPWVGKEAQTRAFVINPYPLRASASVGMTIHGAVGVERGATYAVYTAGHLDARLEEAGTATADGEGDIVLDSGADLTTLTTIIVVPR